MSTSSEPEFSAPRRNPLLWIVVVVIGAIGFVFFSGERGQSLNAVKTVTNSDSGSETNGAIERSLLVPPGMRARDYVEQLRTVGKPYPLEDVFGKAGQYLQEGSLADAHLLYFFAAREDYLPAIMIMAEMSDPMRFRAEDSLLDQADVIQAYKWYQKAAGMGHQPAMERVSSLRQWAQVEAEAGNTQARQLLLNYR